MFKKCSRLFGGFGCIECTIKRFAYTFILQKSIICKYNLASWNECGHPIKNLWVWLSTIYAILVMLLNKQFRFFVQLSLQQNMESIISLVFCLFLRLASVSSVDVNSVCHINSGIGEMKNQMVKYKTIYVERVDLTAIKSGQMQNNRQWNGKVYIKVQI